MGMAVDGIGVKNERNHSFCAPAAATSPHVSRALVVAVAWTRTLLSSYSMSPLLPLPAIFKAHLRGGPCDVDHGLI